MEDIKKNAVNADSTNKEQEPGKRKHTEDDAANTNDQNQNGEANKFQKTGKKDRKRGQNKVSPSPYL